MGGIRAYRIGERNRLIDNGIIFSSLDPWVSTRGGLWGMKKPATLGGPMMSKYMNHFVFFLLADFFNWAFLFSMSSNAFSAKDGPSGHVTETNSVDGGTLKYSAIVKIIGSEG